MQLLSALAVLLCAPQAPSAPSQAGRTPLPQPPPAPGTVLTAEALFASDPPGLALPAPNPAPSAGLAGVEGGPVAVIDVALPEALPLPVPARRAATPEGDVELEPAAGDPFFLQFSAGPYFPPAGERLDPALADSVLAAPLDGRPEPTAYAYAVLARRITPARVAALEELGCRVLGFRPHQALALALPPELLAPLAHHPDVRWLGRARDWQKQHPSLAGFLASAPPGAPVQLYVNLFESDRGPAAVETPFGTVAPLGAWPAEPSPENPDPRAVRTRTNGWQEAALEDAGASVLDYVDRTHTFLVEVQPALVSRIAALDFVQVLEPRLPVALAHDESTPMVHSDYGRSLFNGGTTQTAVAGQIDSGIDITHWDLDHFVGVGWNVATGGSGNPWEDPCWHGTHVAGTVLGNGDVQPGHRGNAPGLGWGATGRYFNIRFDGSSCAAGHNWTTANLINIMNKPAFSTPRPHVINNSWGSAVSFTQNWGPFDGTEQEAVDLDNAVYFDDQAWIFASGNEGPGAQTVRLHGCAKNVLTVGNVLDYKGTEGDPGALATLSSRGPTKDGRWKPNVCAPGQLITSAAVNSLNGYSKSGGTSMATPHVTGIAAQLVDAYSFLQYQPARLASMLMAAAMTKDDLVLSAPSDSHLDLYGAGRVDAMKLLLPTSAFGWTNWGFTLGAGQGTYADFTVASGATRLVVCMHYVEPGAAVGSGKALVSDFDLYIDQAPIDPALNTGEWTLQQSAFDNTEIRILNNPQPGAWRWKIWPKSTPSSAKFGVTVFVINGDTTPDGGLVVGASKAYAQPGQPFDFTATASNPSYVASAVLLDVTAFGNLWATTTTLLDGAVTDLLDNEASGYDVLLGDIGPGFSRSAKWTASWASEGWKTWSVNARSDNWTDRTVAVVVGVDGTPPGAPSGFGSSTHQVNTWSNVPGVKIAWTAPPDNLSGVGGYSWTGSFGAPATPPPSQTLSIVTTLTAALGSSSLGQYLNVRAVDQAGNWGPPGNIGPFLIDLNRPPAPTLLPSPTGHQPGLTSCSQGVTMAWNAVTDPTSGIAGYVALWDFSPATAPGAAINAGGTSYSTFLTPSTAGQWFHVRAVDLAGNLGHVSHSGPYYVNSSPLNYCTAKLNSLGCLPRITASGCSSASKSSGFSVIGANVRNNKLGLLTYSIHGQAAVSFQGGTLCVAAPRKRTPVRDSFGNPPPADDCSGAWVIDMNAFAAGGGGGNPLPELSIAGTVIDCQWWGRDPGASFNTALTDALEYVVGP